MIEHQKIHAMLAQLGIAADAYTAERLDYYAERLLSWNQKFNLTAITEPDAILEKHFMDSLEILRFVELPQGARVIDVGTGAGFPGMPLLFARPDLDLTLADSLHKRLVFLKDVLHGSGLTALRVHERAEILGRDPDFREQYDFAVARAVAPLPVLCEYCLPFVRTGGAFLALKGPADETAAAQHAIEVLGGRLARNVSYKLPSGDDRRLLVIEKVSQTPAKYPRKPKRITARPL